ncbi:hypothetical protein BH24BAC1_BH24BAC1_38500 [soil metagenome]
MQIPALQCYIKSRNPGHQKTSQDLKKPAETQAFRENPN